WAQAHFWSDSTRVPGAYSIGAVRISENKERRLSFPLSIHHCCQQLPYLKRVSLTAGMFVRIFQCYRNERADHCQFAPRQFLLECDWLGWHVAPVTKLCAYISGVA